MKNNYALRLSTLDSADSMESDKVIQAYELIKQFNEQLKNELGLRFSMFHLAGYVSEECQKQINEHGITSIMSRRRLQESLMPITKDYEHKTLLVKMVSEKLQKLKPSEEIIIVDNYIFAPSLKDDEKYLQMLKDIFGPILDKIHHLRFITRNGKRNFCKDVFERVENELLEANPELTITCNTTKVFHDRFWIVDQRAGLFVGTSLNGIGKKYALVDEIRSEDVEDIVKAIHEEVKE